MLRHRPLYKELLYSMQISDDICDLVSHQNESVSATAELVLEYIVQIDYIETSRQRKKIRDSSDEDSAENTEVGNLTKMIRARRFESHNMEWMEMLNEIEVDEGFVEEGKLYFDDGSATGTIDPISDSMGISGELDEFNESAEYLRGTDGMHRNGFKYK